MGAGDGGETLKEERERERKTVVTHLPSTIQQQQQQPRQQRQRRHESRRSSIFRESPIESDVDQKSGQWMPRKWGSDDLVAADAAGDRYAAAKGRSR